MGKPGPGGTLTRSGAQDGDYILVTGTLGGSILSHHYSFIPRLEEIATLTSSYQLHAAIDISDGLSLDLARLAESSKLAARIDTAAIPVSAAAHELATRKDSRHTALEHALADGEDFELLLAASPGTAEDILRDQPLECGISCIGRFFTGDGIFSQLADGNIQPLEALGYVHGEDK